MAYRHGMKFFLMNVSVLVFGVSSSLFFIISPAALGVASGPRQHGCRPSAVCVRVMFRVILVT